MTKEELKKEAIKFAVDYPTSYGKGYKHKDLRIAYLAGAEPREERIEELEKENAELKEKLKPENCLKLLAKDGYVKFTSDQLTHAKEIIREYIRISLTSPDKRDMTEQIELFRKANKFWEEIQR